jgi:quaternary ammonium compound-resistance protein SugE
MRIAWLLVAVGVVFEIGFASCLKLSAGFSKPLPTLGVVVFGAVSLFSLAHAMRWIDAAPAYAVYTGLGATGTAVVAAVALGEALTPVRVLAIAAIISGAVVLALTGAAE